MKNSVACLFIAGLASSTLLLPIALAQTTFTVTRNTPRDFATTVPVAFNAYRGATQIVTAGPIDNRNFPYVGTTAAQPDPPNPVGSGPARIVQFTDLYVGTTAQVYGSGAVVDAAGVVLSVIDMNGLIPGLTPSLLPPAGGYTLVASGAGIYAAERALIQGLLPGDTIELIDRVDTFHIDVVNYHNLFAYNFAMITPTYSPSDPYYGGPGFYSYLLTIDDLVVAKGGANAEPGFDDVIAEALSSGLILPGDNWRLLAHDNSSTKPHSRIFADVVVGDSIDYLFGSETATIAYVNNNSLFNVEDWILYTPQFTNTGPNFAIALVVDASGTMVVHTGTGASTLSTVIDAAKTAGLIGDSCYYVLAAKASGARSVLSASLTLGDSVVINNVTQGCTPCDSLEGQVANTFCSAAAGNAITSSIEAVQVLSDAIDALLADPANFPCSGSCPDCKVSLLGALGL